LNLFGATRSQIEAVAGFMARKQPYLLHGMSFEQVGQARLCSSLSPTLHVQLSCSSFLGLLIR
jgi:hypothetical protein